jgi:FkbM family methyltransferase
MLRIAHVQHFRATSGLGLPFICYLGDFSGELPFYNRKHAAAEMLLMAEWCRDLDKPVLFDVGANNGFVATQLAQLLRKRSPQIYAFEPVPSTFAQLVFAVDQLGLKETVFPIPTALSARSGLCRISFNRSQSLFAQVRDDDLNIRAGAESSWVPMATIDQAIDSLGVRPSLVKIDVEGFEAYVLRGAAEVLNSEHPPAICLEWNPVALSEVNCSSAETAKCLAAYKLFYVDDFEGQRKAFGCPIEDPASLDWVCNLFAVPVREIGRWNSLQNRSGTLLHNL